MTDTVSPEKRSEIMARIKGKNTEPEMLVRRYLYSRGHGYKLHRKDLPGRPDIVLSKHRLVIFVNGCYWHRHDGCKFAYEPKSRQEFWTKKFKQTVERDEKNRMALAELGWRILTIWECETSDMKFVAATLERILKQ